MGSATKHALRIVKGEVDRAASLALPAAEELFDAVDVIIGTPQLRATLADATGEPARKRQLVERLFAGRLGPEATSLLAVATAQRWSDQQEFELGLQELAIRSIAQAAGAHETIAQELASFLDAVGADHELELTLSSKLSPVAGKQQLVERLFAGRLSRPTIVILRHLIAAPAGRRVRRLVDWAAEIVADQGRRQVATVTVAKPVAAEQLERLAQGLRQRFGRPVAVAQVVDPAVIGGLRVQLGDEVIDDTVQTKLTELRRQFA